MFLFPQAGSEARWLLPSGSTGPVEPLAVVAILIQLLLQVCPIKQPQHSSELQEVLMVCTQPAEHQELKLTLDFEQLRKII